MRHVLHVLHVPHVLCVLHVLHVLLVLHVLFVLFVLHVLYVLYELHVMLWDRHHTYTRSSATHTMSRSIGWGGPTGWAI